MTGAGPCCSEALVCPLETWAPGDTGPPPARWSSLSRREQVAPLPASPVPRSPLLHSLIHSSPHVFLIRLGPPSTAGPGGRPRPPLAGLALAAPTSACKRPSLHEPLYPSAATFVLFPKFHSFSFAPLHSRFLSKHQRDIFTPDRFARDGRSGMRSVQTPYIPEGNSAQDSLIEITVPAFPGRADWHDSSCSGDKTL